jgi:hypothetical protein
MQSHRISKYDYEIFAGCLPEQIVKSSSKPFSSLILDFLGDLSKELMKDADARKYPDVISFAFWLRPASLNQKKKELILHPFSIGRGLALHIAPSNVPVNFAFSFAFGLLSGNSNIVRVPKTNFAQTQIILRHLDKLLNKSKYLNLKNQNSFLRYDRDDKVNNYFSSKSDCRLLWGGDQTISYFKSIPTNPRNIDLCFSDRYSISIFGAKEIASIDSSDLKKLCEGFYNDNFLFNQFACSSSHLINWLGNSDDISNARERFWNEMNSLVQKKGQMEDTDYINRFANVVSLALQFENFKFSSKISDPVYRSDINNETNFEDHRVGYGYFSEIYNVTYQELVCKISNRYQTVTYFGIDAHELAENFIDASVEGIDRIVPVGNGLNLDLMWDGYDIIRTLSRVIDVQ